MRFRDFVFKYPDNRVILKLTCLSLIIQWIIFKYLYPFPNFIHDDSFYYIKTANENLDINTYMVGYSRFLRLFSVFNTSDTLLVTFQYLFIELSFLFLLFTIFYFINCRRSLKYILVSCIVFNPLFLHLGNLISSDGFFASLSSIWFALLIWLYFRPSRFIIVAQTIVLFISFTTRYNALIYPFIGLIAFYISPISFRWKITGVSLGLLLCGLFVLYTSYKYKELTGYWQYAPFSGWQLANNAMYAYRYVDSKEHEPVTKRFQSLDKNIRAYFDTTRDTNKYPIEKLQANTWYMWDKKLPLYQHLNSQFRGDSNATAFKKWASMGPLYKEYGLYIIMKYPFHYLKYFIWPNANKYFAPPVEFLSVYNFGRPYVSNLAVKWFRYKNQTVFTRTKYININILDFFPILSGSLNIVLICCLVGFFILNGWKHNQSFGKVVLLGTSLWFFNALFTITASSAALRFQCFPVMFTIILTFLLIDWIANLASNKSILKEPEKTLNNLYINQ